MNLRTLISGCRKPPRKYELLPDDTVSERGQTLYRIRAVRDFGVVRKGELGGYIASEHNLSHRRECWVFGEARVCDRARICGDAMVGGHATLRRKSTVGGMAWVDGEAEIRDEANVEGQAVIGGKVKIGGKATVEKDAKVGGRVRIGGKALVRSGKVNDDTVPGSDQNDELRNAEPSK